MAITATFNWRIWAGEYMGGMGGEGVVCDEVPPAALEFVDIDQLLIPSGGGYASKARAGRLASALRLQS